MDRVLTDRLANLQSQIDALTGVLSSMPPPDSIDRRLITIEHMIAQVHQGRMPAPIPPGIQPSQGAFSIWDSHCNNDTSVSDSQFISTARCRSSRGPGLHVRSLALPSLLSQPAPPTSRERKQQAAAQADEPSRYLKAEAHTMRPHRLMEALQVHSPPTHTDPDAARVNPDYAPAPQFVPQVPETVQQYCGAGQAPDLAQPVSSRRRSAAWSLELPLQT